MLFFMVDIKFQFVCFSFSIIQLFTVEANEDIFLRNEINTLINAFNIAKKQKHKKYILSPKKTLFSSFSLKIKCKWFYRFCKWNLKKCCLMICSSRWPNCIFIQLNFPLAHFEFTFKRLMKQVQRVAINIIAGKTKAKLRSNNCVEIEILHCNYQFPPSRSN